LASAQSKLASCSQLTAVDALAWIHNPVHQSPVHNLPLDYCNHTEGSNDKAYFISLHGNMKDQM